MGIGGSSLGAKAINSFLSYKSNNYKQMIFLENSDPIKTTLMLEQIKKDNAIFVIISKSGTTVETISIYKTILDKFKIKLPDESDKIIVVSDSKSALDKYAQKYNIQRFNIPLNVGGRFSVLSAVGIVPLFLAGFDTKALLDGAGAIVDDFFNSSNNYILKKANYLYRNRDTLTINVVFAYSNLFEDFLKWYIQLWGESLGKIDTNNNRVGLTPIGLVGSVDQHSFLQLIMEGPKNKSVTFIGIDNFENNLTIPNIHLDYLEKTDFVNGVTFDNLINTQYKSTIKSLKQNNIPTDSIKISKINEYSIGSLMMSYELLTSSVGAMLDIDTYNQPGVEVGKKILLDSFLNLKL